jgi:hypothetical protein
LVASANHEAPHGVISSSFTLISSSKPKYPSQQPILKYPGVCFSVLLREANIQAHVKQQVIVILGYQIKSIKNVSLFNTQNPCFFSLRHYLCFPSASHNKQLYFSKQF